MAESMGKARLRRCFNCEHHLSCSNASLRAKNQQISGHRTKAHWCDALPIDDNGVPQGELNGEFLKGPERNCPEGYWDDVEPATNPGKEQLQLKAKRMADNPFVRRLDDSDVEEALVESIEEGQISAELATAIMDVRNGGK